MLAKDWPRELTVGSVSTVAQHGHCGQVTDFRGHGAHMCFVG